MPINLYSKASVDSLLSAKLSISSLSNAAATTLNATAPTTGQALTFDGTELKWASVSGGGASWGSITGTLSSQTDLNTALGLKAPLASPALTGTPTAPTATAGTSTTQIATTAFVTAVDVLKAPLASPTFTGTVTIPAGASISGYATLASPTFTGDPKAPTPATSDNDTSIATTAFVKAQSYLTTSSAAATYLTISNAASTYYPSSNPSGYLDQTNADGLYYSISNPANYIDATAISDMATMTWVNGQGFLTSAPNPSADFMMANAIASLIYSQSTNASGDLSIGNVPQFITGLGTNWGIVDASSTYYYCTGFTSSTYSLSGTAGSGPYYVQVNGTNSAFSF